MDLQKIVKSLTLHERNILLHLHEHISYDELLARSKLKEVEFTRGLRWLSNKGLIEIKLSERELVSLDKNGLLYLKKGLPERRLLMFLRQNPSSISQIKSKLGLSQEEINISIGILKRKKAIEIKKEEKDLRLFLSPHAKELLEKEFLEERIIQELSRKTIYLDELTKSHKDLIEDLKKRKEIVKIEKLKVKQIYTSQLGRQILLMDIKSRDLIESLTHEILINKTYTKKEFRRYDISSSVPKTYAAKRHFVNAARDYIKKIWLEMGFREMSGNIIDSSFWNFDALFVPQDHPARELQDTFFVDGTARLPDKKLVSKIKAVHENGANTKSIGWRYAWDEKKAREPVLRTHTTILSAKTLAELKESDLPAKFFSVGRVFRNEAVDWKHSFAFTQVEGIVVDKRANFRHLLGYLKEYYAKLGFDKVRLKPHYFPYTEMSVDIEVYDKKRGEWIELGGAGIFRPEVVIPLLGVDVPVLAWGQGMERSILDYYKISDLRDLYKNDLKQLREIKIWNM